MDGGMEDGQTDRQMDGWMTDRQIALAAHAIVQLGKTLEV